MSKNLEIKKIIASMYHQKVDHEQQLVIRCPKQCRFIDNANVNQANCHCFELSVQGVMIGYLGLEVLDDIFSKTGQLCLRLNQHNVSNFALSQSLSAMCRFLFKHLDLERLEIGLESDDLSASTLLTSVGFVEEGVLAKHVRLKDEFLDTHLYALLK